MFERLNLAPMDRHNEMLMANAHPSDWRNPTASGRYNMVVVGRGTAGLVTAAGAAGVGGKVALIERQFLVADAYSRTCLTPAVKSLFTKWLARQRR